MNDALLNGRSNNFTALRLMLALSVIYSHSYEIITGNYGIDGASRWIGTPISSFGVDGFFFLSGFLVYPSLIRFGNPLKFLAARSARLWPALVLSVLLTVMLGAILTTAHGAAYLLGGDTRKFVILNLSLVWKAYYNLTGVKCGPDLCNMNGSLWTLPFEAKCYITLAAFGALGLADRKWMVLLVYPLTIVLIVLWDIGPLHAAIAHRVGPKSDLIDKTVRLWPLFALGTAAYVFKDRIKLSWPVLAGLAALYLITDHTPVALQSRALFVGYAVLCLGLLTAERVKLSGGWPDYSYGMYIYAFPAMIAVLRLFPPRNALVLALESGALALPFAVFSWHVFEKPAMEWVKRRVKATLPPVEPFTEPTAAE